MRTCAITISALLSLSACFDSAPCAIGLECASGICGVQGCMPDECLFGCYGGEVCSTGTFEGNVCVSPRGRGDVCKTVDGENAQSHQETPCANGLACTLAELDVTGGPVFECMPPSERSPSEPCERDDQCARGTCQDPNGNECAPSQFVVCTCNP